MAPWDAATIQRLLESSRRGYGAVANCASSHATMGRESRGIPSSSLGRLSATSGPRLPLSVGDIGGVYYALISGKRATDIEMVHNALVEVSYRHAQPNKQVNK